MLCRASTLILALTFAVYTAPIMVAPAAAAQATGVIQGTAQNAAGQTLPNYTVQLRNIQTGQIAGSTTSNAAGSFSFTGLNPGNYVIELVNPAGAIVGTSSAVSVAAGATVTVTVSAAAAGGRRAAAGISTAVIVTTIAAGVGIAAVVVAVTQDEASPSQ